MLEFCRNTVQIKKLDPLSHIVYACLDIVAGPPGSSLHFRLNVSYIYSSEIGMVPAYNRARE